MIKSFFGSPRLTTLLAKSVQTAAVFAALLAAALGLALRASAQAGTARSGAPNIIYIMVDDLGYGDLGSYGQTHIQTPNLDRMAKEGTRFTQFYSGHTVCGPSRWTLMTGRHTGHTRVRGNVAWEPRGDVPLRERDTTLIEIFDRAGYATGVYGKWALGLKGTQGAPHRQGVDAFLGYEDQSEAHDYYVDRLQGIEHGVTVNVDVDTTQYTQDLFVEAALHFVEQHQKGRPFFLYLPFTIPHAEMSAPRSAIAPYLNDAGESIFSEGTFPENRGALGQTIPLATYAGMVTRLDRDVGRLLDKLRVLGLDENTLVFFTSDNGPHAEGGYNPGLFDSNGPLRGMKRDLYEGGIRVPMIAWGPGIVPAGHTSDHVWAAWDALPTLADIAGLPSPSRIDGRSMAGAVRGTANTGAHEYLYWEFYRPREDVFLQAVRSGRWKALRRSGVEQQTVELYDLHEDLEENSNIASEHPAVVRRLTSYMTRARDRPEMEKFQVPETYTFSPPDIR